MIITTIRAVYVFRSNYLTRLPLQCCVWWRILDIQQEVFKVRQAHAPPQTSRPRYNQHRRAYGWKLCQAHPTRGGGDLLSLSASLPAHRHPTPERGHCKGIHVSFHVRILKTDCVEREGCTFWIYFVAGLFFRKDFNVFTRFQFLKNCTLRTKQLSKIF